MIGERPCRDGRHARADHRNAWRRIVRRAASAGRVRRDVQTLAVDCCIAGANGSKHRSRGLEGAIEAAEAPKEASVAVRITAIQGIAMVQVDERAQRARGIAGPQRHHLSPGHAHVVVQFPVHEERGLRRIPERVARARAGESFPGVQRLSFVAGVRGERLLSPGRERREVVVGAGVECPGPAHLSPDEQLIEIFVGSGATDRCRLARDSEG